MRWGLLGALASLTLMAVVAAAVLKLAPAPRVSTADASATRLARSLTPAEVGTSYSPPQWIVTRAVSASHMLVVDVEADHPEQAVTIAREIVDPVRGKYEEVLIYVRAPGSPRGGPVRRIRWTPRGGFAEASF